MASPPSSSAFLYFIQVLIVEPIELIAKLELDFEVKLAMGIVTP